MTGPDIDPEIDDELAADFMPISPGPYAISALVHGLRRPEIAEKLRISRVALGTAISSETTRRAAELPSEREAIVLLHAGIDDVVARTYAALNAGGYVDSAPLLAVLNETLRLKAGLMAREARR